MSSILKGILNEGISAQDLADVLYNRLTMRYPDIVNRYGHEVVGDIVSDVASFHEGADELGSSDIGIMIRQIINKLENYNIDEAIDPAQQTVYMQVKGLVDQLDKRGKQKVSDALKKNLGVVAEGEQKPGEDYKDPEEADYDEKYQEMVKRVGQKAKQQQQQKSKGVAEGSAQKKPLKTHKSGCGYNYGHDCDCSGTLTHASDCHYNYGHDCDCGLDRLKQQKQNKQQGVAEGSSTTWEVSFDYGPHMSETVKVKAGSEEEARAKVEKAAEKRGRSIMINWAMPAEQGVAEGSLNEFALDGFNGGDDGEEFNPRMAKMAYDEGVVKGASLADGATLERAMAINDWDKHDGGIYSHHFAKGFKAGRLDKIRHNNKQYNLNLKLMKDGSIRHGEQGVAEGSYDDADTSMSEKLHDLLQQGMDYKQAVNLVAKTYNTYPEYVVGTYNRWGNHNHDPYDDFGEQGVAEGWKDKVAGGALALGALGGLGALQNAAPNVTVQGHQMQLANPGTQPDDAKLVTTDDGKKVYAWKTTGHKNRSQWVYRPIEQVKEQGVAEAEKNPHTSALGKALYRDLSKEKKASPQQVEKNKARWTQRQAEREQGVAEEKIKGADGKACWPGYRYNGTENGKDSCVKVKETKSNILKGLMG